MSVERECARLRLLIRQASRRLADLEAGRTRPREVTAARAPIPTPTYDDATIRAWARTVGIPVGSRGRLPADLIERYVLEHAP